MAIALDKILLRDEWFPLTINEKGIKYLFPFRHPITQLGITCTGLVYMDVDVADKVIEPALIRTREEINQIQEEAKKYPDLRNYSTITIYEEELRRTSLKPPENLFVIDQWLNDPSARTRVWEDRDGPLFRIKWFPIQGFLNAEALGLSVGIGSGGGSELYLVDNPITHGFKGQTPFSLEFIDAYQLKVTDSKWEGKPTGWKDVESQFSWNVHNMDFPARLFCRNFAFEYNNEFLRQHYRPLER